MPESIQIHNMIPMDSQVRKCVREAQPNYSSPADCLLQHKQHHMENVVETLLKAQQSYKQPTSYCKLATCSETQSL
eukprot:4897341-Amphidinium_carterae.1